MAGARYGNGADTRHRILDVAAETHRAEVIAKLDQLQQHLKLIDYKIDVHQGRLSAGDADRLWATTKPKNGVAAHTELRNRLVTHHYGAA